MGLRDDFEGKVIAPFIDAYARGVTPNPCILCNRYIKFPSLLKIADERGGASIATGHYARVKDSNELQVTSNSNDSNKSSVTSNELKTKDSKNSSLVTRYSSLPSDSSLVTDKVTCHSLLLKGVDPGKDQSYVLYALGRKELDRLALPLGNFRKEEVRKIARGLGLSSGDRPESQEICFIGERKYFSFMEGLSDAPEGPIIDIESGKALGNHKGIHRYTMGQRKGLGIATGVPLYVAKIDPLENTVYVGPKEAALGKEFLVEDVNWLIGCDELSVMRNEIKEKGSSTHHEFRASVKVRSTMRDEPATVIVLDDGRARVMYDEPQWAPAPGQGAVFYQGDVVMGGGVISGENV